MPPLVPGSRRCLCSAEANCIPSGIPWHGRQEGTPPHYSRRVFFIGGSVQEKIKQKQLYISATRLELSLEMVVMVVRPASGN